MVMLLIMITPALLPEKIGTIPIVQFDSPENLEQGHNNKMVVTSESGEAKIVKKTNRLNSMQQRFLIQISMMK